MFISDTREGDIGLHGVKSPYKFDILDVSMPRPEMPNESLVCTRILLRALYPTYRS